MVVHFIMNAVNVTRVFFMLEFSLLTFANDKFKLLQILSDTQKLDKDGIMCIELSQQEIADLTHMSKLKCNKLLNELIDDGFVSGSWGIYFVTDKGAKAIYLMNKPNV